MRKSAASATSSVVPKRLRGICERMEGFWRPRGGDEMSVGSSVGCFGGDRKGMMETEILRDDDLEGMMVDEDLAGLVVDEMI